MPRITVAELQSKIEDLETQVSLLDAERKDSEDKINAITSELQRVAGEALAYRTRAHRAEYRVVRLLDTLEQVK